MVRSRCKVIDEYERPTKFFINFLQISYDIMALCENVITMEEVKNPVISLDGNKTPGSDGLPSEFYNFFGEDISDLLHQSYLHAFESGKLSASQKQGVITLVSKKGKNLTDLKSWRPISILNTDYKILAKVVATRIKKALPEINDTDQIGYMEGRFCGENIRLISDIIIDFCSFNKKPGLILLVDFEKAFDTVNLSFLKKSVTKYGFGKNFQKWISILYNNIVSCVTNNGYQSQYFQLTRGIGQGCPLSALLFLLIAEVIANTLRSCENVRGIKVKKNRN